MFGKARDFNDIDTLDSSALDGILGDEAAASAAADFDGLRARVEQVEAQISSQFTSLATYAQIAQEQVELARSEARASIERSEQRVTSLIERERADRIAGVVGHAVPGAEPASPALMERLDVLERSVDLLKCGLDDCRQQQKALAMAITTMFERLAPSAVATPNAPVVEATPAPPAAETLPSPLAPPASAPLSVPTLLTDSPGPISGLALNG